MAFKYTILFCLNLGDCNISLPYFCNTFVFRTLCVLSKFIYWMHFCGLFKQFCESILPSSGAEKWDWAQPLQDLSKILKGITLKIQLYRSSPVLSYVSRTRRNNEFWKCSKYSWLFYAINCECWCIIMKIVLKCSKCFSIHNNLFFFFVVNQRERLIINSL